MRKCEGLELEAVVLDRLPIIMDCTEFRDRVCSNPALNIPTDTNLELVAQTIDLLVKIPQPRSLLPLAFEAELRLLTGASNAAFAIWKEIAARFGPDMDLPRAQAKLVTTTIKRLLGSGPLQADEVRHLRSTLRRRTELRSLNIIARDNVFLGQAAQVERVPDSDNTTRLMNCGGFRRSGSSAVHKFLSGLHGVTTIQDPRLADTEFPITHSLLDFPHRERDARSRVQFFLREVMDFFVVKEPFHNLNHERPTWSILARHSMSGNPEDLTRLSLNLERHVHDMLTGDKDRAPKALFSFLREAAGRPRNSDEKYLLLNQAPTAWAATGIGIYPSGSVSIAVHLDPRDQFFDIPYTFWPDDQDPAAEFIKWFLASKQRFANAKAALESRINSIEISFEEFFYSTDTRKAVCDTLVCTTERICPA